MSFYFKRNITFFNISHKPVIVRRHWFTTIGAIPTRRTAGKGFDEFAISVENIDNGSFQLVDSSDVPSIVITIAVWGKKQRSINNNNVFDGRSTTV